MFLHEPYVCILGMGKKTLYERVIKLQVGQLPQFTSFENKDSNVLMFYTFDTCS